MAIVGIVIFVLCVLIIKIIGDKIKEWIEDWIEKKFPGSSSFTRGFITFCGCGCLVIFAFLGGLVLLAFLNSIFNFLK